MTSSFIATLNDDGPLVVEVSYHYDTDPGTYDTPPSEELFIESVTDTVSGLGVLLTASQWRALTEAAWQHAENYEPEHEWI